jgi:hypothetical protein
LSTRGRTAEAVRGLFASTKVATKVATKFRARSAVQLGWLRFGNFVANFVGDFVDA